MNNEHQPQPYSPPILEKLPDFLRLTGISLPIETLLKPAEFEN